MINVEDMSFDNFGFFPGDSEARPEWESGNHKSGRAELSIGGVGWRWGVPRTPIGRRSTVACRGD